MIIKADEEGKKVILQLCDIALKASGLQNLKGVLEVINKVELLPPLTVVPKPEEPNDDAGGSD